MLHKFDKESKNYRQLQIYSLRLELGERKEANFCSDEKKDKTPGLGHTVVVSINII